MKILLLIILLSGCAPNAPIIYYPDSIRIIYSDRQMIHKGKPMSGASLWGENTCTIILPKNDLRCATHEIMHCFMGAFHKENPSRRYCYK